MRNLIIAIDGGRPGRARARSPAPSRRRSAIATSIAVRCTGLSAGRRSADHVPLDSEDAVSGLAASSSIHVDASRVAIDDVDVTHSIRTPEIDRAATSVARLAKVRAVLVERQRALGQNGAVVMEGRDIGTVVFPNADLKIYLDASADERARCRDDQPALKLMPISRADSEGPTAVRLLLPCRRWWRGDREPRQVELDR